MRYLLKGALTMGVAMNTKKSVRCFLTIGIILTLTVLTNACNGGGGGSNGSGGGGNGSGGNGGGSGNSGNTTSDTTPPDTIIISEPPSHTKDREVTFEFKASEDNCGFECQLDDGRFSACASPKKYSELSEGSHVFLVRAIDAAGNVDPSPAIYVFTKDPAPDTFISSTPSPLSNATGAIFEFDCDIGPCTFECKLDFGAWMSCAPGITYSGLVQGQHTFQVRASDAQGNQDPSPAIFTWTIDSQPPDTFINTTPPNPSISRSATFTFICTGGSCTFQCQLDTDTFRPCQSPAIYGNLEEGVHTFQVRAVDSAFNIDTTPASYSWSRQDWLPTSMTTVPDARIGHSGIWTGSEFIIWGGVYYQDYYTPFWFNTGGRYNPATDTWIPTSLAGAPAPRSSHSGVWTGTDMIIWGGDGGTPFYNDGSKYRPSTDSWTQITYTNAPCGRAGHSAVWTGTEMIVWSGELYDGIHHFYITGGRYNPESESWTETSTTKAPDPRRYATAIWTGTEMIVWGGNNSLSNLNTGGRYNPSTDTWRLLPVPDAPRARYAHTAVWTGSRMIVFGGYDGYELMTINKEYDPAMDVWYFYSMIGAPTSRYFHTAVWTGTEMIIWGGYSYETVPYYLKDGGIYNPATDSWKPTSTYQAPQGRYRHVAAWTGAEMVIWGGEMGNRFYNATGGVYRP
jgi:hypothetical protein